MGIDRRKFLTLASAAGLSVALSGCNLSDQMTLEELLALLKGEDEEEEGDEEGDSENFGPVKLGITYPPAGVPMFLPAAGFLGHDVPPAPRISLRASGGAGPAVSTPRWAVLPARYSILKAPNTIKVSVTVGGKLYEKSVTVTAVSSAGFAAKGME